MPTVLSDKQKYITRSPDGLMIGPVSRRVVIDLIRDRKVTVAHTFSVDGGPFTPASDDDEFRQHLGKYESLPPKTAPAASAPSAAAKPVISEQAKSDLDALEEDDDEDDADFSLDLHELKETVLELTRMRQKLEDDTNVIEALSEVEPVEPLAPGDEEVLAMGDEAELSEIEPMEEVEVLELDSPGTPPQRQTAKVPTSGRTRLKSELMNPQNRYTIRNSDGLLLGPVRIATVRDLIEAGALDRRTAINKNDEGFTPAWELPEVRFLLVRLAQKK